MSSVDLQIQTSDISQCSWGLSVQARDVAMHVEPCGVYASSVYPSVPFVTDFEIELAIYQQNSGATDVPVMTLRFGCLVTVFDV